MILSCPTDEDERSNARRQVYHVLSLYQCNEAGMRGSKAAMPCTLQEDSRPVCQSAEPCPYSGGREANQCPASPYFEAAKSSARLCCLPMRCDVKRYEASLLLKVMN
jgi:hypothetical protein